MGSEIIHIGGESRHVQRWSHDRFDIHAKASSEITERVFDPILREIGLKVQQLRNFYTELPEYQYYNHTRTIRFSDELTKLGIKAIPELHEHHGALLRMRDVLPESFNTRYPRPRNTSKRNSKGEPNFFNLHDTGPYAHQIEIALAIPVSETSRSYFNVPRESDILRSLGMRARIDSAGPVLVAQVLVGTIPFGGDMSELVLSEEFLTAQKMDASLSRGHARFDRYRKSDSRHSDFMRKKWGIDEQFVTTPSGIQFEWSVDDSTSQEYCVLPFDVSQNLKDALSIEGHQRRRLENR